MTTGGTARLRAGTARLPAGTARLPAPGRYRTAPGRHRTAPPAAGSGGPRALPSRPAGGRSSQLPVPGAWILLIGRGRSRPIPLRAPGPPPLTAFPHGRPHRHCGRRCPPSSLRCPSLTPYPLQSSQPSCLNLQDFLLLHPLSSHSHRSSPYSLFCTCFLCSSFSFPNATSMPPRSGKGLLSSESLPASPHSLPALLADPTRAIQLFPLPFALTKCFFSYHEPPLQATVAAVNDGGLCLVLTYFIQVFILVCISRTRFPAF